MNKKRRTTTILNEDVMFDIFSRLPIQALSECRYVCRDWYKFWINFTTNPFYVQLYNSQIHEHNPNFFILCRSHENFSKVYWIDHDPAGKLGTSLNPCSLSFDLPTEKSKRFKVVGSCNGLLCLVLLPDNSCLYICNPITREVIKLPEALGSDSYQFENNVSSRSSGFAFDAATNTYKVVRTWLFKDDCDGYSWYKSGLEIYTLGTGTWRRIKAVPAWFHEDYQSPVVFRGAFHWEINSKIICALHVNTEKFRMIKLPVMEIRNRTVNVLVDCLCLINKIIGGFEFWILGDYKDDQSWLKASVIRNDSIARSLGVRLKLLRTMNNGDYVVNGDKGLGYYDLEKGEFKRVQIHDILPSKERYYVDVHVANLISPGSIDPGIIVPARQGPTKKARKS